MTAATHSATPTRAVEPRAPTVAPASLNRRSASLVRLPVLFLLLCSLPVLAACALAASMGQGLAVQPVSHGVGDIDRASAPSLRSAWSAETSRPPARVPPSPKEVLASIDPARFSRLLAVARRFARQLPWGTRLGELGLDRAAVTAALEAGDVRLDDDWPTVFDPFVGHWVGGDLHDAARGYRHRWWPSGRDEDLVYQTVVMTAAGRHGERTQAYDWISPGGRDGRHEIRGLVGGRAHVGVRVPKGGLVWVGEGAANEVTVHAERVRAGGQLYEVRGMIVALDGHVLRVREPSDWRYHRVRPRHEAIKGPN